MRKSYLQPPSYNQQRAAVSFSEKRTTNLPIRDQKRNNSSEAKKVAAEGCSSSTSKKVLERKKATEEEDINASADAFIKNFRKQLLIQRLQSIENYEQMLARGL